MNKEEKALIKAIKSKNQAEAVACLKVFSALKNTTDEAANKYFEAIEAIDAPAVEEVVVEVAAPVKEKKAKAKVEKVVEVVVEAPRVENRGVKATPKSRKELNEMFNKLYEASVDYLAETSRLGNAESKFARRLSRALHLINKQIFR